MTNKNLFYVVGSGPSGVACAHALLEHGKQVKMLDVGQTCEPDIMDTVNSLGSCEPHEWPEGSIEKIRGENKYGKTGMLQLKQAYGSNYPYALEALSHVIQDGTECFMSYARGGLSNVWGAAMLPNTEHDFIDWPISLEDLAPHYTAIAQIVKIAGSHDGLEHLFPYYAPPIPPISLSRQAHNLNNHMTKYTNRLLANGITFGQSRLAVHTQDEDDHKGCRRMGLCLTGCPYQSIYNSGQTLEDLLKHPEFTYLDNLKVVKIIEESPAHIKINCHQQTDDKQVTFEGARVFLGCGVLSTTRIILNSMESIPSSPLKMRYPPYFLLPSLLVNNTPDVENERLHTLSQLFIEFKDDSISDELIHLQLYTYNDMVLQYLNTLPVPSKYVNNLINRFFSGRIIAIQGYLNSKTNPGILVEYTRDTTGSQPIRLHLSAMESTPVNRIVHKIVRKLIWNIRYLGVIPVAPMLSIGKAGYCNHLGGVFPMKHTPNALESDIYGRVGDFNRIHIIDGTILPSIPAPTYTYTVMANAHRIGTISSTLDK